MGTSMSFSQREKAKHIIRNHAMNRNKIPANLQKYYRYHVEYMKTKHKTKISNNKQQFQQKLQLKPLEMQKIIEEIKYMDEHDDSFINFPHDIPSIQHHSQLKNNKQQDSSSIKQQRQGSQVQEYAVKQQKIIYKFINTQQQNQQMSNKYDNNFKTFPIQSSSQNQQNYINNSLFSLPFNSKPPNSNKPNIQNDMINSNSNKTKSIRTSKQKTQSNHALSEIILQRQPCFVINYQKFNDDIKQQAAEHDKTIMHSQQIVAEQKDYLNYLSYKKRLSDNQKLQGYSQNQQIIQICNTEYKNANIQTYVSVNKNLQSINTLKLQNYPSSKDKSTEQTQMIEVRQNNELTSTNQHFHQNGSGPSSHKHYLSLCSKMQSIHGSVSLKPTQYTNLSSFSTHQSKNKQVKSQLRPKNLLYF